MSADLLHRQPDGGKGTMESINEVVLNGTLRERMVILTRLRPAAYVKECDVFNQPLKPQRIRTVQSQERPFLTGEEFFKPAVKQFSALSWNPSARFTAVLFKSPHRLHQCISELLIDAITQTRSWYSLCGVFFSVFWHRRGQRLKLPLNKAAPCSRLVVTPQ